MNIKDELMFWTSIMRDHANFQLDALSAKEEAYLENSTYYMDFFKQAYSEIKDSENLKNIYPKLIYGLRCFIDYKRTILKNQLTCSLSINLPPTAISHQIIEANQFMMVLSDPTPKHMEENMHTMLYVEHLKQWLSDSAAHAGLLSAFLDSTEGIYQQQTLNFKMNFEKLVIKASEFQMMLMFTGLEDGILLQLGQEAIDHMTEFICFCEKIKELRANCRIMAKGTFTPLVPDHFIREHQHWIANIKEHK